jgi:hypothetical protein
MKKESEKTVVVRNKVSVKGETKKKNKAKRNEHVTNK